MKIPKKTSYMYLDSVWTAELVEKSGSYIAVQGAVDLFI